MAEMGAFPLPCLPRDVGALETSLRHSVTGWKAELKSLKRSTTKAKTKRAGTSEFPGLQTRQETPSPARSEASSGAVTPETLSDKVSRLRRSGEEYIVALKGFTDILSELGLEREDIPSRSRLALGQLLINRRQEEAETVE